MCGRFYVDDDIEGELFGVVKEIDEKYKGLRAFNGDIKPSMLSPVVFVDAEGRKAVDIYKWGFTGQSTTPIINARAESVNERVSFAEPMENGRCIVPARSFYEWNKSKNKFTFYRHEKKLILMASLYRFEPDSGRFVIITTKANNSMSPVHDRMPVVLKNDMVDDWLYDSTAARDILKRTPEELEKECKYEQIELSIFKDI